MALIAAISKANSRAFADRLTSTRVNRRAWTLLFILGAIWGASYLFIEIGLRDFSPGMVAWLRVALGPPCSWCWPARAALLRGFSGRAWTLIALGALQVAGPFVLIAAGQQEISSSLAGILVTSAPLFTALLAIWIDQQERAQGSRLAGILLGVAGVGVLLGVDLGGKGDQLLGALAVILAGLGYAVGGFIVKHRLAERPPIGVAAWIVTASTVLLAPVAVIGFPGAGARPRAGGRDGRARRGRHRRRLRDLLRPDRHGWPCAHLHRHLPRPWIRRDLRGDAARRDDHAGDDQLASA